MKNECYISCEKGEIFKSINGKYLRESPGRTGNDRRGTGNNRDGTVAPPGPIQTLAELRQRSGCRRCSGGAPVNAGRVPV
ncbi:hypothetical protein DPMN_080534 [Dreissena polymorpha]|uniref:Uncharacterized protein n=1 Tax=Dreissena polymorpha TaxID=45954 RepID=A0A9D3YUQ0_DREPO|nr:hypothetical protein DPMN_080534 [Dreissena polymorpha]